MITDKIIAEADASARLPRFALGRPRCLAALLLALALLCAPLPASAQDLEEDEFEDDEEEFLEEVEIKDYADYWEEGRYREALEDIEIKIGTMGGQVYRKWRVDRAELRFAVGLVDEAIEDMELVTRSSPDAKHMLQLALYYKYRGRMADFDRTLKRASDLVQRSWRYGRYADTYVVIARVAELMGENPKTILGTILARMIEGDTGYPPALVAAGDLAYRNYDYQLAAEYYAKALKTDEDNQDAMIGLVECYWKSSDPRLQEAMRNFSQINPRHPRLRAIRAELAIDVGKLDEALGIIEQALEANPNDLRHRSLQSAALFLNDDLETMERVQREVLEFNPFFSGVFRTTGRIASRHYRFAEAAQFQREALETDPNDHIARGLYGIDLMRLDREAEGKAQLEEAFEGDPFNIHVFNMLKVSDLVDGFARIERGPFVLRVPEKEVSILAEDSLSLLQEAFDEYEEKYKIELTTPVHVQVFDNHDDFMVRSVGLPGSVGYMGICFGQLITMDSPSARAKWSMNWRSVLWHEFVHIITLQKTNNRMPRWFSEGISVYEETERSPAWGQRIDPSYGEIIAEEGLPGLTDLEGLFTQAKSQMHLMFGYFLAGEFVGFYVEAYGFDALVKSLELIGEGKKTEPALAEAAGVDLDDIDDAFKDYSTERLAVLIEREEKEMSLAERFMAIFRSDDEEQIVAEADVIDISMEAFGEAMEAAAKASQKDDWETVEAELLKAHEIFPDYMGADAPLRRLIDLYKNLDRIDDLKRALRQEIDWNQSDFPACQELAALLRGEEQWAEVAELAHWSLGIDPFDVEMRRLALEGQLKSGKRDEALTTLGQLIDLDSSHATDYQVDRIELLMSGDQWESARSETVALLERIPHYWKAQQLLLEVVEREEPGGAR